MRRLSVSFLLIIMMPQASISADWLDLAGLSGGVTQHFLIVEALKFFGVYIALPIGIAVFVFIEIKMSILSQFLSRLRRVIYQKICEWRFKEIYKKEDRRDLQKQLIRSALNEASSTDATKKTLAIAQLTQFSQEEEAINGLIGLLGKEKHNGFRKIIIQALYEMTN